jgi:hypothetical protein
MIENLANHFCDRKTDAREAQYDARGIFLCYTCDKCHDAKMAKYRPDVLTDSNYWHDEDIDAD